MVGVFKATGVLRLNLNNLSDNSIVCPSDFGVKNILETRFRLYFTGRCNSIPNRSNLVPAKVVNGDKIILDVMPLLRSLKTSAIIHIIVLVMQQENSELSEPT